MFPQQMTIQLLELRVNKLSIDLLQEQQVSDALGTLVLEQSELIESLYNKILALEAIIDEDAKPQKPTRRKLADSEAVQVGDIVVKFGRDDHTIQAAMSTDWTAVLLTQFDGYEVWRPL